MDEHLTPRATALDEDRLKPATLTAVGSLSTDRQDRLRRWFETKLEAAEIDETAGGTDVEADTISDPAAVVGDDQPNEKAASTEPDDGDRDAKELFEILGNRAIAIEFANHLSRTISAPLRANLLRSSLLVTAFGAFEVLIGTLVREFYLAHPSALGDEPKFTLKDLQDLETLDDAREQAISLRVDSLLQTSFESWEKWFSKYMKIEMKDLCIDRRALDEMFQRRHIIVHNNGQVSRLYLRRLAGRPDLPDLGVKLSVTRDYLESALDQLDTLGTLLSVGTRCKLFHNEQPAAMQEAYERSFELMVQGRWLAVRKLCNYGQLIDSTGSLREVFRANEWLTYKRLDEFDSVTEQVRGWDVSALHDRFRFARLLLFDHLDKAFPVADQLMKGGALTPKDLATWPMLREFRDDNRYQILLDEHSDP